MSHDIEYYNADNYITLSENEKSMIIKMDYRSLCESVGSWSYNREIKPEVVDKLYENKYEILHELIVRKLSNVSFYKNIYNNHYYTDELVTMLDNIEQRYKFPKEMITDLIVTIASNTYAMLATKDFVPLMSLCSFWQNVVILSSNKYYKKILCFKNTFKVDVLNMDAYLRGDNIPCHYISDYIIKRIKNEYPNDITTYDDMIKQLYQKTEPIVQQEKSISKLDQVFLESKIITSSTLINNNMLN